MWDEFKQFIKRGNVLDLAVAISVGTAFTNLVKSLVADIIMPPVGLLLGYVDFSNLFAVLKEGVEPGPYATLDAANAAGAVTLRYGLFVNTMVSLLIISLSVFFIIKALNRIVREVKPPPTAAPATRACPYCQMQVSLKATRCPHCTSELEGAQQAP